MRALLPLLVVLAACSPVKPGQSPLDEPDDLLASLPRPEPETLRQEVSSSFIARPANSPPTAVGSGGSGSTGDWKSFIANYPTYTVVDVVAAGNVSITVACPGCSQGNLGPAGRLLFPSTCTGYGAMYLNWRSPTNVFQQWDACSNGASGSLLLYGPVNGGRAVDSGPGCPCFTGCQFQGCCCNWSYQGGGDTIRLQRVDAKLEVTVDQMQAAAGELVRITPSPSPANLRGLGTPFYLQGYRFDPDPPTDPKDVLVHADYEACERIQGGVCQHRMRRSGVLRTGAMVNGKYFEVPKRLEVICTAATCKCNQDGELAYDLTLPWPNKPLAVRCSDKLGGGQLGVEVELALKAQGKKGTCFNDCEAEHEGEGRFAVKGLMCDKTKEVSAAIQGTGKWKSCKECSSACFEVCKDNAGCRTLGVGGAAEGAIEQTLNPKWLQAAAKKLKLPGVKLQCGIDLGITMGASARVDWTKDFGGCTEQCEDCMGSTVTVKGGALARGACAFVLKKPGQSAFRPAGACQACIELKADANGSYEQKVGACANKDCFKMESKYSGRAQLQAKVPLHWFEVDVDCGIGGEGCTAANTCGGGCGTCANCDDDDWKTSCNVKLATAGDK